MKTKYLFISLLIFCAVTVFGQQEKIKYQPTKHYTSLINTGNNMTVGIPDFAWPVVPEEGDEIGVFNASGDLVGSSVFLGGHSAVAVWGDDETTNSKEGVPSGERFVMKLWSHSTGQVSVIEVESWLEGDDIYKSNGISIVEKMKLTPINDIAPDFGLSQNVPNPVRDHSTIDFTLPRKVYVEISLFTASGEFVEKLLSADLPAGSHKLDVETLKYASGNYCYKMTAGEFSASKTMNIVH